MRRTSTLVLGLTMLAVLALVASGCGGGGKKAAASTTTEATTTAAAVTTTTEAATTEAATTEATTTTSKLGGVASVKNCRELTSLGQKFSAAFTGASGSQSLKTEAKLLQEFAGKTPSAIRADFEVLADYMTKIASVAGNFKPGTTPDAATIAKLQKLSTQIDQAKLTQASAHIQAWVQKNCHA